MGVIQGAVNQAIGTIGLAARLSPELEEKSKLRAEEGSLAREIRGLEKQQKELEPILNKDDYAKDEPTEAATKMYKKIENRLSEIKERQFELNPTKGSVAESIKQMSAAGKGTLMTIEADPEEIRQEQAVLEAERKRAAQKVQLERFAKRIEENMRDVPVFKPRTWEDK